MKNILRIIQKEFLQIRRNKTMLPIIFVMPLIQLLILSQAATFELKNIRLHIADLDRSVSSRELIRKFEGSPFYKVIDVISSEKEGEDELKKDHSDLVLVIANSFDKKLQTQNKVSVQLIINSINSGAAGLVQAYTLSILNDFNQQLIAQTKDIKNPPSNINILYSFWYNPEMNYLNYMIPGILVLLVTLIGMFLSSMNIVREKEIGTIEQINVTPIKKYEFIAGKLIPFWIIALFELAFGLAIGKILFNIPINGSLGVLFSFAAIYLLVILSIGLFISTINDTQQQAMFLTWFFMVIFILMSGLFTPTESMPEWAQQINTINPIKYFIEVTRMVLLKGSGFADLYKQFLSITVYAILMLSLSTFRYKKTDH